MVVNSPCVDHRGPERTCSGRLRAVLNRLEGRLTRYGFERPTAGTIDRGRAEWRRQWSMIEAAGGVTSYVTGPRWRPDEERAGDQLHHRLHQHERAEVLETTNTLNV